MVTSLSLLLILGASPTAAAPPSKFCPAEVIRANTRLGPHLTVTIKLGCPYEARVRLVSDLGGVLPRNTRGYWSLWSDWPRSLSLYTTKCTWTPQVWDGARWNAVPDPGRRTCARG